MEWRQSKPTIKIERAASEDAVILRPYRQSDEATLRAAADDVLVARYMFAGFPHPYTAEDAAAWVSRASAEDPVENFVIEVGEMFAGAVGLSPRGKGYEGVGVVGYWLNPEYWGSGIATAVVDSIVNYAVENGFRRLVASVYAPNVGSARVLEKNGFVLEGRLREHRVGRDGVIMDELLFGRILRERNLGDASTAG